MRFKNKLRQLGFFIFLFCFLSTTACWRKKIEEPNGTSQHKSNEVQDPKSGGQGFSGIIKEIKEKPSLVTGARTQGISDEKGFKYIEAANGKASKTSDTKNSIVWGEKETEPFKPMLAKLSENFSDLIDGDTLNKLGEDEIGEEEGEDILRQNEETFIFSEPNNEIVSASTDTNTEHPAIAPNETNSVQRNYEGRKTTIISHPIITPQITDFSQGAWTRMTITDAPSPRSGHMMTWTGSKMLLWGGHERAVYKNDGGIYDPTTDSWTEMDPTNAPAARAGASVVWTGKEMIIWGGYNGEFLNSGGKYDPLTNTWSDMTTSHVPSKRNMHASVWTGSKLVVWGGWNGTRPITGGQYDPEADTWTDTTTTNTPDDRIAVGSAWTGTHLLVWGGERGYLLNTGGLYNPSTNSWDAMTTVGAPAIAMNPCTVNVQGKIYAGFENDLRKYDPQANSWSAVSKTNMPLMFISCREARDKLFQLGHMDGGYGHFYDPALDEWKRTSSNANNYFWGDIPSVWTGSSLIIWGGSPIAYNTGWLYTP